MTDDSLTIPDPPAESAAPGPRSAPPRLLMVTGMSGAGKSTALKALEDMGYEAVDNVPISLLGKLVLTAQPTLPNARIARPVAIGVDIRTRDFGVDALLAEVRRLIDDVDVKLLFLDCDDEELRRRYMETRHRHPLAVDRPVEDGIMRERQVITPLRQVADVVVDSTGMPPGDLKRVLRGHFDPDLQPGLAVFVTSFSFRKGLPREADLVFDVRFLTNPHYDPELRPLTGLDPGVGDYVSKDAGYSAFFEGLTNWLMPLLPRFAVEGKSYLTIAVGCTGGRHRSVFVAERLAEWLAGQGQRVQVHHRDLAR